MPTPTARSRYAIVLVGVLSLGTPGALGGQEGRLAPGLILGDGGPDLVTTAIRPVSLGARCDAPGAVDPVVARVSAAMDRADPVRLAAVLDSIEAHLASPAGDAEAEVLARYRRAVVLGARVDTQGGRARLEAAERLYHQTLRVLELDHEHPGAHHLMGRLHAAVIRLGGARRMLARLVAGGELLSKASLEGAEDHLARAEAGAPCVPEHHFELARILMERDDPDGARRELHHVLELTARARLRELNVRTRALAALAGG